MAKSKSSRRWLQEHHSDPYVKRARELGYRSRASFKLIELADREHLFKPGGTVVDLGAAPGGWSQVASERVGPIGRVVASDILPMDSLPGVEFIRGDFTELEVLEAIKSALGGPADVVLSDMAPNMSGVAAVDQTRAQYLVELALDLAVQVLAPGGIFVCKVFHGEGFDQWLRACRAAFQQVSVRKPDASRSRSKETYAVARSYRGSSSRPL